MTNARDAGIVFFVVLLLAMIYGHGYQQAKLEALQATCGQKDSK